MNEHELEIIENAIVSGIEVALKEIMNYKPDMDYPPELKIIHTMNLTKKRVHLEIHKNKPIAVY